MSMDECIKCQTVSPTRREVINLDIWIVDGLPLDPEQQRFFGSFLLSAFFGLYFNVFNSETKNDRPNQSEN